MLGEKKIIELLDEWIICRVEFLSEYLLDVFQKIIHTLCY